MEVSNGDVYWLKPKDILQQTNSNDIYIQVQQHIAGKNNEIESINHIHYTLEEMHKGISTNNQKGRTKLPRIHKAKTKVLPFNFHIGENLVSCKSNAHHQKLNTGWIGTMPIVEAKLDLMFVVEY